MATSTPRLAHRDTLKTDPSLLCVCHTGAPAPVPKVQAQAEGRKGMCPGFPSVPTLGTTQEGRRPLASLDTALSRPARPAADLSRHWSSLQKEKRSFKAKAKQKPPELFLTIWLFWGRHASRTAAGPLSHCTPGPHIQPACSGARPPGRPRWAFGQWLCGPGYG